MDWLEHRQDAIEAGLARRHLAPEANPSRMALFDLSSSWLEGRVLPAGRPRLLPGRQERASCRSSTGCSPTPRAARSRSGCSPATPATPPRSPQIVEVVRKKFGLAQMVMVGDRGMITSARIRALNQREDGTPRPDALRVDHRAARPRHQKADGRRRPAADVACSTSRTSPRSPPRTSPASGWSPAATRSWPPTAPAPARTCSPPPRSCSPPSSPGSRPASSPAPGRSASRSAR